MVHGKAVEPHFNKDQHHREKAKQEQASHHSP